MTWEYAIPKVTAGDTANAAVSEPMGSDEFAQFYERSARQLRVYLARVSGDPALADDLMQESYVRFLCAARQFDGEVACRKYLFRIATNMMKDYWRKPKGMAIEEFPEEVFAVGDGSAQSDSRVMLGPALAQMRPRDRQILWLAHAENYTHSEIAEITGLGATSVRLLLFRARRKLAALLRHQRLAGCSGDGRTR